MRECPEVLKLISGKKITTKEEWETFRRPEIKVLFENFMYGKLPEESRIPVSYTDWGETRDEKGRRMQTVTVNTLKTAFRFFVYLPEYATHRQKVPAILYLMFGWDKENEVPIDKILKRGYAVCCFPVAGAAADSQSSKITGVYQDAPKETPHSWGAISVWAWATGKVMDYLQTMKQLQVDKIGIAGHSRGGKTALWTFANDTRFAICLALNSGCGGASLSRGKTEENETIASITQHIGYWFADCLKEYAGKEELLPVDQHMLLALAAPRPIYVTSATQDYWSDPDGELESCLKAGSVYQLYGMDGLIMEEALQPDISYQKGQIAYHRRTGVHGYTWSDWEHFFNFADRVLEIKKE